MQGIHRKERENKKRKTLLTHTGLLMEGVSVPDDRFVLVTAARPSSSNAVPSQLPSSRPYFQKSSEPMRTDKEFANTSRMLDRGHVKANR
jgi:hypothetical protein